MGGMTTADYISREAASADECKHSYESVSGLFCTMGPCVDCIVPEGFFCSYGERKED